MYELSTTSPLPSSLPPSLLTSVKEYVCVIRLHDAIASEAKLAQVGGVGVSW